jgi:hypothetical protein
MIWDADQEHPREWEPISACAGYFEHLPPTPAPLGGPVPRRDPADVQPFHANGGRGILRVGSRIGPWRVSTVMRALPENVVFATCVVCGIDAESTERALRAEGESCKHRRVVPLLPDGDGGRIRNT